MNVPKILLISHGPPPSVGGAAHVLYRLFKMLSAGSYVVLTTDFIKITDTNKNMKLPCKYYYAGLNPVPYTSLGGLLEWLMVPYVLFKCLEIIKKENINKILVHPSTGTFLFTAYLAYRITKIPFYLYMLDLFEESKRMGLRRILAGPTERLVMHAATNVFVMSESMQEYYYDKHNIETILLPHPIDVNGLEGERENQPLNKQKHKIVFTGGMIYDAQINAIVNLVQAIKNVPEIEFHIYTRNTEEYIKKFGITGNNIIYSGYVDSRDIPNIQKQANILFLPAAFSSPYPEIIKTASPVKITGYLASGTPIVVHAPPDSYISWYARKRGWGMVIDKPNPELLKEAILRLLGDGKLQQDLIKNAQKTALLHDQNRVFGIFKKGLGISLQTDRIKRYEIN